MSPLAQPPAVKRRAFLASTALTAAGYRRVLGANERIAVGIIGAGDQGFALWARFLKQPDVTGAAVCDVYQPHLEKAVAASGGQAEAYRDFRQLLGRSDIDAVIVATPDHWHALPTILACQAGKDVYIEKPLALTVREGRLMVNAARRYNRVVQVGSQQRSGAHYARAIQTIRGDTLGKVAHVTAGHLQNAMPGLARQPDSDPPPELDWEMWLGPAPYKPYNPLRSIYHFRWYWDYSGGQMTNWGAHELDIVRWAMDVRTPLSVAGFGGRYALEGVREIYDVQEVLYNFPGFVLSWSIREMNASGVSGLEFHGTKASLALSRHGFRVIPEFWGQKENRRQMAAERTEPGSERLEAHIRNFLDCVKSRQRPNADVEEGHWTATLCHLGNIATRLGRALRWDAEKEEIPDDAEANGLLSRDYRKPWELPQI